MGLLDGLGSGGGLLDFLRQNAMNQQMVGGLASDQAQYAPMQAQMPAMARTAQPSPLDTAQWPFGPMGAPSQEAALPQNAQPTQGQLPTQQPQQALAFGDSYLDRVNAGGGLIRSLFGSTAKQQQQQQLFDAYKNAGLSPQQAYVAVLNPQLADNLIAGGQAKAPTSLGNGYVWNPATKKVEQAYKEPSAADKNAEEIAGREKALRERGLDPRDPKYAQFALSGKWPREDAQPLTATDKKAIMSAEDDNVALSGTFDVLKRAKELNDKTFTGFGAGVLGTVGTSVPGAGYVLDEKTAKNTREFGQLMTGEAVSAMSKTLKGATTDREMERFIELLANPSTPPEIRGRTIDRLLQLAERQKQINDTRINDLRGGTYYKQGGGVQPTAAPAPAQEAPAQFKEGATATNPQTGQKLTFRNGKWQ